MIKIDAEKFRIATSCISTEETRYYLCGVYIEPHHAQGALLVTTDGHRLLVIHDENGECSKPAIISTNKAMLSACQPPKGKLGTPHFLTMDDAGIVSVGYYRSPRADTINGTYPEWRKVVPKKPEPKEGEAATDRVLGFSSFNSKYIAEFAKIAALLTGEPTSTIRLLPSGSDPALVLFPRSKFAFGILMPMRTDDVRDVPAWMSEPPKAPAEPSPAPTSTEVVRLRKKARKSKIAKARRPQKKQPKRITRRAA